MRKHVLKAYKPKSDDETQVVSVLMRISKGMEIKSIEVLMLPYATTSTSELPQIPRRRQSRGPDRVSKLELAQAYAQLFSRPKISPWISRSSG